MLNPQVLIFESKRRVDALKVWRDHRLYAWAVVLMAGGFVLGAIFHEVLGVSELEGALRIMLVGAALWLLRAYSNPGTFGFVVCSTVLLLTVGIIGGPLRHMMALGIVPGIMGVGFGFMWPLKNFLEWLDDSVAAPVVAVCEDAESLDVMGVREDGDEPVSESKKTIEFPFLDDSVEGVVYHWLSGRPAWPDFLVGAVKAGVDPGIDRAIYNGTDAFVEEKICQALEALEVRGYAVLTDDGWVRAGIEEACMGPRSDIEEPLGVGWISAEQLDGAFRAVANSGRECHSCPDEATCHSPSRGLSVAPVRVMMATADIFTAVMPVSGCEAWIEVVPAINRIMVAIFDSRSKFLVRPSGLPRRDQYALHQLLQDAVRVSPRFDGTTLQSFDAMVPKCPPDVEADYVSHEERKQLCLHFGQDCAKCPNSKGTPVCLGIGEDGLSNRLRAKVCAQAKQDCGPCENSGVCPWNGLVDPKHYGEAYLPATSDDAGAYGFHRACSAVDADLADSCEGEMRNVAIKALPMVVSVCGSPVIDLAATLVVMIELGGVLSAEERFAAGAVLHRICYKEPHLGFSEYIKGSLDVCDDGDVLPLEWLFEDFQLWNALTDLENEDAVLDVRRVLDTAEDMLWSSAVCTKVKRSILWHLVSVVGSMSPGLNIHNVDRAVRLVDEYIKFSDVVGGYYGVDEFEVDEGSEEFGPEEEGGPLTLDDLLISMGADFTLERGRPQAECLRLVTEHVNLEASERTALEDAS